MKETHIPARDRLETLKEMGILRNESYKLMSWSVEYHFSGAYHMVGDEEYPVRLEAQVSHPHLIRPHFERDAFFRKAHAIAIEGNTSALNGPRLSYALEIPVNNIIHLDKNAVERDLHTYIFTLYQSGIVRMSQQMRSHDLRADVRRVGAEEGVRLLNTVYMDKQKLDAALLEFLPLGPYGIHPKR